MKPEFKVLTREDAPKPAQDEKQSPAQAEMPFAVVDGDLSDRHALLRGLVLDVDFEVAILPLPRRVIHQRDEVDLFVADHRLDHLDGIVETETMIAFRAYSKQELEAGFELGLD